MLTWERRNSARAVFPLRSAWVYPKDLLGGLVQL